jgi:hypothetical protein
MSAGNTSPEGGCACGGVRYRLDAEPMIVHCCHCRWCQRESGAAFALNALIETGKITLLQGQPEHIATPSNSGKGQDVRRCPDCKVTLWSHYNGAGSKLAFVRVGTLDDPDRFPPDVHIFTESKQPWVTLADGKPALARYYKRDAIWPAESLERLKIL